MTRISPVLLTKSDAGNQGVSLALVNHWIEDLRAIPYGFSTEWKTPEEVEFAPEADCKGKAVALYQRMQLHGAEHVRLVIQACVLRPRDVRFPITGRIRAAPWMCTPWYAVTGLQL